MRRRPLTEARPAVFRPLEKDAAVLALGAVSAGKVALSGNHVKRAFDKRRSRKLQQRLSKPEKQVFSLHDRDRLLVLNSAKALIELRRDTDAHHYNPDLEPELIELIDHLGSDEH